MRSVVAQALLRSAPDLQERVRLNEEKITYMDGHERKRTAALLWLGSVFGLLGFLFAFVIGSMKFLNPESDEGHSFPSGRGYFPPTVSEMVHDPRDPAGKAFFAFEFLAALFIFISWYPWELGNVYMGDDEVACCGISWPMLRQFIPAPGMMLVATVTSTPIAQANILDWFTITIHLTGAMMMFVGYVIVEGKTLGWGGFTMPATNVRIEGFERHIRVLCLNGVCFWYCTFFALQIFLGIPGLPVCCNDKWQKNMTTHKVVLVDTASGPLLMLKVLSYVSEVICGLSLICSHLCIWYYCKERHIDLAEELVDLFADSYKKLDDSSTG